MNTGAEKFTQLIASEFPESIRRRPTSKGGATFQRIIDACIQLLTERGESGMSISAVSSISRASSASIYHHFKNKNALIAAVYAHCLIRQSELFWKNYKKSEDPTKNILSFLNACEKIEKHSQINAALLIILVNQPQYRDENLSLKMIRLRRKIHKSIVEYFMHELGVDDGAVFANLFRWFNGAVGLNHQLGAAGGKTTPEFQAFRAKLLIMIAAARPDLLGDPRFAEELEKALPRKRSKS